MNNNQILILIFVVILLIILFFYKKENFESTSQECPTIKPCFPGEFLVQEDGTLQKKDNNIIYNNNGNLDIYNFTYQKNNNTLNTKNTSKGNSFNYTNGILTTPDIVYQPNRTAIFGNFKYDLSKNLTRSDNNFIYDISGIIKKNNITINKDNSINCPDFNYIPNNNLTFDKFSYSKNGSNKVLTTNDNNFKYDITNNKITKNNIIIDGSGNITTNNLNYIPNNNLTFDNFVYSNKNLSDKTNSFMLDSSGNFRKNNVLINQNGNIDLGKFTYDTTGLLRETNNTFTYDNNNLNFNNFTYDNQNNLSNTSQQFLYKTDGTINKTSITINPDGIINLNKLNYNSITGEITNTEPKFIYNNNNINTDKFNYVVDKTNKKLFFDDFIYQNNNNDKSLIQNNNKFKYDNNGNIISGNFTINNQGQINNNNITIDSNGQITSEYFNYNNNKINMNNLSYDIGSGIIKKNDNRFNYDKGILTNNDFTYGNNNLTFGNFNYDSTNNKISNNFTNINYNTINNNDFVYDYNNRDLSFNNFNNIVFDEIKSEVYNDNLSYDKNGLLKTNSFSYDLSNNIIFDNWIYDDSTNKLNNIFNDISINPSSSVKLNNFIIDNPDTIKDLNNNPLSSIVFDQYNTATIDLNYDSSGFTIYNGTTLQKTYQNIRNFITINIDGIINDSIQHYNTFCIYKAAPEILGTVSGVNGSTFNIANINFFNENNIQILGSAANFTLTSYGASGLDKNRLFDPNYIVTKYPLATTYGLGIGTFSGITYKNWNMLTFSTQFPAPISTIRIITGPSTTSSASGNDGIHLLLGRNGVFLKDIYIKKSTYPNIVIFSGKTLINL